MTTRCLRTNTREDLTFIRAVVAAGARDRRGVYVPEAELRDLVDVAIYVDTSEQTRDGCQVARNVNSAEWIRRCSAAEQYYLTTIDPQSVAAVVVSGAY